jgi:hypothetical protein
LCATSVRGTMAPLLFTNSIHSEIYICAARGLVPSPYNVIATADQGRWQHAVTKHSEKAMQLLPRTSTHGQNRLTCLRFLHGY